MKTLAFLLLSLLSLSAQAHTATIKGIVKLSNREPAAFAVVYIEELKKYATTNDDGKYHLHDIPYGEYDIQVRTIEAEDFKLRIKVNRPEVILPIALKENKAINLSEVVVRGKSKAREIKSNGFAVGMVDLTKAAQQSFQATDLLDRTSGVRLRQSGGLGSDVQYNINGLSGNSIRIFIDGIPIRNYGSSFSLSNIPPSMIERIEVFKGVVPGQLAEDALGGAINVVMKKRNRKNLSTSYSYGSFNTHRWDMNANMRSAKTGLTFRGSAFYNYSDNNYKVWGDQVYVTNPVTGEMSYVKAKRFHDSYQSYGVNADFGFTDVKWADAFMMGLLYSNMNKDIQHGATMAVVYGNRTAAQDTKMVNLKYEKRNVFKGFDVSAFVSYSHGIRSVVDTLNYRYNWQGTVYKTPQGDDYKWSTTGEAGAATLAKNKENMWAGRMNAAYQLMPGHRINVNYLLNKFTRDIDDPMLSQTERDLTDTRHLLKGVLSATYESRYLKDKIRFSAFYKCYHQNARLIDPEKVDGVYVGREYTMAVNTNGYGGALSYTPMPELMITLSGEKALRLPDETELLGNASENIDASYSLKPEESINLNLGITAGPFTWRNHRVALDLNLYYRDIKNMISRSVSNSLTAETYAYENLGKVLSKGLDAELSYGYGNFFQLIANLSLFNARFNLKQDEYGVNYAYYGDRLRNAPYFTSNINAEFTKRDLFLKGARLIINYNFGFVHEFFRNWESLGGANKTIIPSQLVHDMGITYSFPKNRVSLAFDAKNILNEQVFDNWALQKAGRAFYGKITYTLF